MSEDPSKRYAPFDPQEIASLNAYQASAIFHPYTCGTDSGHSNLIATVDGWHCEFCDYKQAWAHRFTCDGSWATGMFEMWRKAQENT